MKQNLYLGIFTAFVLHLSAFASEHYRQSVLTGLMVKPQLRIITLETNLGYTLNRSQIRNIIDLSHEIRGKKIESYMAVFDQEGMVTYSYFHNGPEAGKLLVYPEDPTKKPLNGHAADFNYLRDKYLENKTTQK